MLKKISLLIIATLLSSCLIGSGENSKIIDSGKNKFPSLVGIDLEGNKRELPNFFDAKYNIISIGFEREHQEAINGWIKIIDPIIAKNNHLKYYEVPLIYELGGFSRAWVNNGMRFGIQDKIARKRTITVYTNRTEFFRIMNMSGKKIYTLILDKEGNVIWRAEGLANEANIKSLENFLKKLKY